MLDTSKLLRYLSIVEHVKLMEENRHLVYIREIVHRETSNTNVTSGKTVTGD